MTAGRVAQRAPITQVFPSADACGLDVDPRILADPAKLERLKLMLAAVYEGVEITGNTDQAAGPGNLVMYRRRFIGAMETLSLVAVNKRLAGLPSNPVRLLARGPKVMQWVLVLHFRAQMQHIQALERIGEIVRAVVTQDPMYDRYMLELFVPESDFRYTTDPGDNVPDEGATEVAEAPPSVIVGDVDLYRKISAALNFDLEG